MNSLNLEAGAGSTCFVPPLSMNTVTLKTPWLRDVAGNKVAKAEIALTKAVAPAMACQVIDWAIQVHGGGGLSDRLQTNAGANFALITQR